MFKPFECDSITVPSCDEHNTKKSGRDQAIVSAFLLPLYTGRDQYDLEPEIEQAIDAALLSFERVKHNAIRTSFIKDPPPTLVDLPDLAYLVPEVDTSAWIRQLTAGIVYNGIGPGSQTIALSKAKAWSPNRFPSDSPVPSKHADEVLQISQEYDERRLELDKLTWQEGWSATPRPYPKIIYSFQVHLGAEKDIIFRHKFYNRYTWYVQFRISGSNLARLIEKLSNT
jgi:hypothetical protein